MESGRGVKCSRCSCSRGLSRGVAGAERGSHQKRKRASLHPLSAQGSSARAGASAFSTPKLITGDDGLPHQPGHLTHNGTRPSAAATVADAAARTQWPRPISRQPAPAAAPLTAIPNSTHAIRCARDSIPLTSIHTVIIRYMGRHFEGCPKEKDIIPQEAATTIGRKGYQRYHVTKEMRGMRAC